MRRSGSTARRTRSRRWHYDDVHNALHANPELVTSMVRDFLDGR